MTDQPITQSERAMSNPAFVANITSKDTARNKQKASRDAIKMNRRIKIAEDSKHAADVWKDAARAVGAANLGQNGQANPESIATAADAVVAASLAAILSGDPQFVPQHGKEAMDLAKAASGIARDYKARAMLDKAAAEVGLRSSTGGIEVGKLTELVTKLQGRLGT